MEVLNKLNEDKKLSDFILRALKMAIPELAQLEIERTEAENELWKGIANGSEELYDKILNGLSETQEKFIERVLTVQTNPTKNQLTSQSWKKEWRAAGFSTIDELLIAIEKYKSSDKYRGA